MVDLQGGAAHRLRAPGDFLGLQCVSTFASCPATLASSTLTNLRLLASVIESFEYQVDMNITRFCNKNIYWESILRPGGAFEKYSYAL